MCTVELTSVLVSLFQSSEQNYNNLLNVKTFYPRLSRKSLTDGKVWRFTTCMNIDAFNRLAASCSIRLFRLVIHRLDASCFINLQQVCKYQVAASLWISTCSKSDELTMLMQVVKIRLAATWYPQTCCKLFHQLAASLQITSCSKSDRSTCSKSDELTMLMQVDLSDLLQVDICRLAASWRNKLQQVCGHQVAASGFLPTWCKMIKSTGLTQLVINLHQVCKICKLHQVCGVSGCVCGSLGENWEVQLNIFALININNFEIDHHLLPYNETLVYP